MCVCTYMHIECVRVKICVPLLGKNSFNLFYIALAYLVCRIYTKYRCRHHSTNSSLRQHTNILVLTPAPHIPRMCVVVLFAF